MIISPAKDEERYIEYTLRSVAGQTIKPVLWLIVDDGSTDRTPKIIRRYALEHSFIKMVRNPHAGVRQSGSAVMRAFNYGLQLSGGTDYDFIVKLDCDLSFEQDYFEKILKRFGEDRRLGIASGVYLEMTSRGAWHEIHMPSYHAAGASKVIRRECFASIGGFITAAGWDTVDEIRAMTRGWKTVHFSDLRMRHHKAEGTGIGTIRTSAMHGEIFYLTGGGKLFFILKVLHRMATQPYVFGALALLKGYLKVMGKRKPLLVTDSEARCYRSLLYRRIRAQAKGVLLKNLNALTGYQL